MKTVHYESSNGEPRDRNAHVKPGDQYKWEFIHGPIIRGVIIDVEPDRKISFTFGDESKVDVLLTKSGERTLVHLCQRDIPLTTEGMVVEHLNCRGAWIHFLTVLKSVVEFKVDCRDKESLTGGSLTVGFFPKEYSTA
jgi:hypothetical protein